MSKKGGLRPLSGFVNGVLRNISRNKDKIDMPDKESPEYISVKYSYPLWIVKMWLAQYDFDTVEMVCSAGNRAPDVCIAANTLKTNTEELKKQLNEIGISTENGYYIDSAVHIKGSSDLSETESFIKGCFMFRTRVQCLLFQSLILNPGKPY